MNKTNELLRSLEELQLVWLQDHYEAMAQEAADKHWTHVDYL